MQSSEFLLECSGLSKVTVMILCQEDPVSHDQGELLFTTWNRIVIRGAVVGPDLLHKFCPFSKAALVVPKHLEALHAGNERRPPLISACQAAAVDQVGFLQFEQGDDALVS